MLVNFLLLHSDQTMGIMEQLNPNIQGKGLTPSVCIGHAESLGSSLETHHSFVLSWSQRSETNLACLCLTYEELSEVLPQ